MPRSNIFFTFFSYFILLTEISCEIPFIIGEITFLNNLNVQSCTKNLTGIKVMMVFHITIFFSFCFCVIVLLIELYKFDEFKLNMSKNYAIIIQFATIFTKLFDVIISTTLWSMLENHALICKVIGFWHQWYILVVPGYYS